MRSLVIALVLGVTSIALAAPAFAYTPYSPDWYRCYAGGDQDGKGAPNLEEWADIYDRHKSSESRGNHSRGFRTPRFAALEAKIDSIAGRSDDWGGSVRYRWEARRQGGALGSSDGFRQSIDFRLGGEHRISPELSLGFRLRAFNTGGWGGSAFGSNPFGNLADSGAFQLSGMRVRETRGMGLDQAYVRYTPDWAGTYETADGDDAPRLEVTAGEL